MQTYLKHRSNTRARQLPEGPMADIAVGQNHANKKRIAHSRTQKLRRMSRGTPGHGVTVIVIKNGEIIFDIGK